MDFVIHGHLALVLEYEHSCQQRRLRRVPLYVPPFWACTLVGVWCLVCLLVYCLLPVLVGTERLRMLREMVVLAWA